jgi:hypothetical protein
MYANSNIKITVPFFSSFAEEWDDGEDWGGVDDGSGECSLSLPDGGTADVYLIDRSEWTRYNTQRQLGAHVFFRDHYGRAVGWRYPTVNITPGKGYELDFTGHCPAGK